MTADRLGPATRAALDQAVQTGVDLARTVGVSKVSIHRWRRGTLPPTPEHATKLARAIRRRALKALEAAARLEAVAEGRRTP